MASVKVTDDAIDIRILYFKSARIPCYRASARERGAVPRKGDCSTCLCPVCSSSVRADSPGGARVSDPVACGRYNFSGSAARHGDAKRSAGRSKDLLVTWGGRSLRAVICAASQPSTRNTKTLIIDRACLLLKKTNSAPCSRQGHFGHECAVTRTTVAYEMRSMRIPLPVVPQALLPIHCKCRTVASLI